MANANKHSFGSGAQGKGSGSGAMTELPDGILPENMVLSNRDKAQHSDERGLDSKNVQTEQYQDHAGNRRNFESQQPEAGAGNTSGMASPSMGASGENSSLKSQREG